MLTEDSTDFPLLVEVARSPKRSFVGDLALVLMARGVEPQIVRLETAGRARWAVLVEELDGPRARAELDFYRRENSVPRRLVRFDPAPGAWIGSAWYVALLLACFVLQGYFSAWRLGIADAEAIVGGRLSLAVTALLLHGDLVHLAGNLFFGALFGYLVAAELGSGVAWLGILLAGALGNGANALFYLKVMGEGHYSLGASTAVFGAVGLMGILGWVRGRAEAASIWKRSAGPVMGLVLLGLYGMGGAQTDVSAHVLGLLSGALVGAGLLLLKARFPQGPLGICMGLGAGLVLTLSSWCVWA